MRRIATAAFAALISISAIAQKPVFSTDIVPVYKNDDDYNAIYALYNRLTDSNITSYEYSGMSLVYDGYAMAFLEDGAHYFINDEGGRAYGGPWMTDATVFSEGLAWIADGKGNLTAVNTKFEPQFSFSGISANAFHDGFAVIRTSEGYGILDKKGNLLGGKYYADAGLFVVDGRIALSSGNGKWALFSVEQGKAPRQLTGYDYYSIGIELEEGGIRELIKSFSGKYIPAYKITSDQNIAIDRSGKEKNFDYQYVYYYDGIFRCTNDEGDSKWFDTEMNPVPVKEEDESMGYDGSDEGEYDEDDLYKVAFPGTDLFIRFDDDGNTLVYEDGRVYSKVRNRYFADVITGDYFTNDALNYLTAFSLPRYSLVRRIEDGWSYLASGGNPAEFFSSPIPATTKTSAKPQVKGVGSSTQGPEGKVLIFPFSGEALSKKYSDMSFVHNGYAVVQNEDGTFSYINDSGDLMFGGRRYKSATTFSYGKAFVSDFDNKIHCIDTEGNDTYTLTGADYVFSYNEGYAVMKTSQGGWGVLDLGGNIKFQNAEWTKALPYVEGYSFYVKNADGKWGSLDPSDGKLKLPFLFDGVGCQPTEGLSTLAENLGWDSIPVKIGDKYALAKAEDGKYITGFDYDFLIKDGSLFQASKDNGHIGWIDQEGNTVIDFNYGWAGYFRNHKYAPVSLYGDEDTDNVFYIDMYGKEVSPRRYFLAENISNGGYISVAYSDGGETKWILYGPEFNVIDDNYLGYSPINYSDLIIATDNDGRLGIIDSEGQVKTPFTMGYDFDTIQAPGRILPYYMYKWMTCYNTRDDMDTTLENAYEYY